MLRTVPDRGYTLPSNSHPIRKPGYHPNRITETAENGSVALRQQALPDPLFYSTPYGTISTSAPVFIRLTMPANGSRWTSWGMPGPPTTLRAPLQLPGGGPA